MNISYGNYSIELINEPCYSLGSADNNHQYEKIFIAGDPTDYSVKYGLSIKDESDEIASTCLLVATTGAETSVCGNSCVIDGEAILVCVSNVVFYLSLTDLELKWHKEADFATAFGIYKMNDDFIIHGELSITRINRNGEIVWQKEGNDIFLCGSSDYPIDDFYIKDNLIYARSWDERTYCISYDGELK